MVDIYGNEYSGYNAKYVNLNGVPIERTPRSHPYSYESFVTWRNGSNEEITRCIYTDRLLQWDFDKHDRLCEKYFGDHRQYWNDRDPHKIEQFLRDWTQNKDLKLIAIMQGCNWSSGFPIWSLHYSIPNTRD